MQFWNAYYLEKIREMKARVRQSLRRLVSYQNLKGQLLKIRGDKKMKCPKCCQEVDKVWAIPDGMSGRTIFGCWNCLHNDMMDFGYSRSQVIRYTKLAELNKDLEKEIEDSGMCNNDFEPIEFVFDQISTRCPMCGYNWENLLPFYIHDTEKCPKKHCSGCGGHAMPVRREPLNHEIRRVSPFTDIIYLIPATASAAN